MTRVIYDLDAQSLAQLIPEVMLLLAELKEHRSDPSLVRELLLRVDAHDLGTMICVSPENVRELADAHCGIAIDAYPAEPVE